MPPPPLSNRLQWVTLWFPQSMPHSNGRLYSITNCCHSRIHYCPNAGKTIQVGCPGCGLRQLPRDYGDCTRHRIVCPTTLMQSTKAVARGGDEVKELIINHLITNNNNSSFSSRVQVLVLPILYFYIGKVLI